MNVEPDALALGLLLVDEPLLDDVDDEPLDDDEPPDEVELPGVDEDDELPGDVVLEVLDPAPDPLLPEPLILAFVRM